MSIEIKNNISNCLNNIKKIKLLVCEDLINKELFKNESYLKIIINNISYYPKQMIVELIIETLNIINEIIQRQKHFRIIVKKYQILKNKKRLN